MERNDCTVGEYLLTRLKQVGIDHLFGVPGDFVLAFINQVLKSDLQYIGMCNELNAAYAADGYARLKGIGAFATTYAVGDLSALNGVAGAFAEHVPVVAITGAPSTAHFRTRPLLHHTLGDYQIPRRIYDHLTVASTHLSDGETAPAEIDRVLTACLAHQQPVYISLPTDVVRMHCAPPKPFVFPEPAPSNPAALREAVDEAVTMLEGASRPVIVGDVELIRFRLQAEFAHLLDQTGLPYATMMLGKTVLDESHPQFIGLYQGEQSRAYVRQRVETADCVLTLGALMTDLNTGGFTVQLDGAKTISANIRTVKIRHHSYADVCLKDFILSLAGRLSRRDPARLDVRRASEGCIHRRTAAYQVKPGRPLTIRRLFDLASSFLSRDDVVIAETGAALFSAAETHMPEGMTFLGQAFYGSIGYTVGATVGACLAAPGRRVVLFVGDGSFQVTCQDLSTIIRNRLQPIIFLLNNDGYTIERAICDRPYNDLQPWKYHRLVDVFGTGLAFDVRTEGELEDALVQAAAADSVVFIEVHTDRLDCSESLQRAGATIARTNHLNEEPNQTVGITMFGNEPAFAPIRLEDCWQPA
jgi:indolepyruvate decarboxylase